MPGSGGRVTRGVPGGWLGGERNEGVGWGVFSLLFLGSFFWLVSW